MKHLVIVTVYNKPTLTRRCVESIAQTTDLSKNILYIVDDHSNQKTKVLLELDNSAQLAARRVIYLRKSIRPFNYTTTQKMLANQRV